MLDELVRHVIIMGLEVRDPVRYSLYCARMRPILTAYGGRFVYDFVVSEVIESPTEAEINRVCSLSFPSPADKEAFFADRAHQRLLAELYEPAVVSTTLIGAYEGPS
ncbi:MAG: DUF1330 domain-containing protein [Myxococcota bacterium]